MNISDEQIKLIANGIAFNVHQYIIEHQEEYQKFLEEDNNIENQKYSSMQKGDNLDENELKETSRSPKPKT